MAAKIVDCPEPDCGAAVEAYRLALHQRQKHGGYVCDLCGKRLGNGGYPAGKHKELEHGVISPRVQARRKRQTTTNERNI